MEKINPPDIMKKHIMTIPCEEKYTDSSSKDEPNSIIRILQQY